MIISGSVISQSSEYITGNSLFRNGSNQVSNINYRVYLNSQMTSLSSGCSGYAGTIYNGNPSIWNMPTNTIIVEPQWSEAWTDYKSGVSTIDATLIQSWANNGVAAEGYKEVAADVNESNIIATNDANQIQQLILGNISKFTSTYRPTTPSWYIFHEQTVPSAPTKLDAINIHGVTPTKSFSNIYGNTIWQFNHVYFNYRLTKMGDVSSSSQGGGNAWVCGSYSLNNFVSSERNADENKKVKKGYIVELAVSLEGEEEIVALQFPIDYDNTKFKLVDLTFAKGFSPKWNYNPYSRELTFVNLNEDLSKLNVHYGEDLINIKLETLEDIADINQAIQWSKKTEIELVTKEIELAKSDINLEIRAISPKTSELEVYGGTSKINANLNVSAAGSYEFGIYNLAGQRIYSKQLFLPKGVNQILIEDITQTGVYVASLRGNKEVLSTKFFIAN